MVPERDESPNARAPKPLSGLVFLVIGAALIGGAAFWVGSDYLSPTVTLEGTVARAETDPARGGTGLRWFGSDVVDFQLATKVSPTTHQPYFRLETTLLQDGSAAAEVGILKPGTTVRIVVNAAELRTATDYLARSHALQEQGKRDETWYMLGHPQFVFAKSVQVAGGPLLEQSRTALWIVTGLMVVFGLLCLAAARSAFRGAA